jgi:hypothetical protein
MFDKTEIDLKIEGLIDNGQYGQAEQELRDAYTERKLAGDIDGLAFVTGHLASLYSLPMYEDLAKAQAYYEEHEVLSPTPYTLRQTTFFYFYLRRDFAKTIAKVDEIRARWDVAHDANYYSALALKGEALLELGEIQATGDVLEEILAMIRLPPARLAYGDEVNLLSATVARPALAVCSRTILKLILPRIRSQEYVERVKSLLAEA